MKKFDWSEKYQLLANDSEFLKKFENFMQKLILEIRDQNNKVIKVDQTIYNFIDDYIIEKRKKNINKLLRKKDI